mmetsp:Transcript_29220/g.53556  ORF Transcript_29220/g.53556 Transcript_29220/m.53556 type:complete len:82 (-) Transcript_29220:2-247(-)
MDLSRMMDGSTVDSSARAARRSRRLDAVADATLAARRRVRDLADILMIIQLLIKEQEIWEDLFDVGTVSLLIYLESISDII